MRKKIFAFDLDGTLIKPGNPLHKGSFEYALSTYYGIDIPMEWSGVHGSTDKTIIENAVRIQFGDIKTLNSEAFAEIYQYMYSYTLGLIDENPYMPFDDVSLTLNTLKTKGHTIGMCTGNSHGIADLKAKSIGVDNLFEFYGTGEAFTDRADIVKSAIERIQTHFHEEGGIYIVGDTPKDIESALVHGYVSIGISTGIFSNMELVSAGAHYVYPRLSNILELI